MAKRTVKAWNGGSREAAMAAAQQRMDVAAGRLRAAHAEYLTTCGPMFITRPFRSRAVPGWIYLPVEDCVILIETARALALVWANDDPAAGTGANG